MGRLIPHFPRIKRVQACSRAICQRNIINGRSSRMGSRFRKRYPPKKRRLSLTDVVSVCLPTNVGRGHFRRWSLGKSLEEKKRFPRRIGNQLAARALTSLFLMVFDICRAKSIALAMHLYCLHCSNSVPSVNLQCHVSALSSYAYHVHTLAPSQRPPIPSKTQTPAAASTNCGAFHWYLRISTN